MKFLFEDLENRTNFVKCKDVNPSGIKRFAYSPLLNAAHLYYSFNKELNPLEFLEFNVEHSNYIISAAVNHSPEDWTGYHPRVKSLFKYLNKKYVNDLKSGKALLLLDQSFEGYQTPWLWEFFHNEFDANKIPPQSTIYVTGNMIADETYSEWCDKHGIVSRMKVVPYTHFELDVGMTTYHMNKENLLPDFQKHIDYKTENLKDIKTFACLNKRTRPQRVWFYKYLYESGLLPKGMVSMNNFYNVPDNWEGKSMSQEEIKDLNESLPLLVYGKRNDEFDDNYYIRRINDQVCLDTFITVVSEAHCADGDETMFLSEKLFKPIACKQPFMVMGNKDSLRMMRKMGYKTFDGFLDETYDGLPTHERLQKIIETLREIDSIEDKIEWFKSMQSIVEYNYTNLIDKLFRVPDSFAEIIKYHNNYFNIKKPTI